MVFVALSGFREYNVNWKKSGNMAWITEMLQICWRGVRVSSYYIDYENVHNEGLNGVDKLERGDRLCLFYSCKADTLKIDVVHQLMMCAADIRFEKIDNGVENALDFQLITALMCNYSAAESYYIISKDKGYDAAIEMAAKKGRDNIYRCRDIDGALKHQSGLGIDESDQEVIVDLNLDADRQKLSDGEEGQTGGMAAVPDSGAGGAGAEAEAAAVRAEALEKIISEAGREESSAASPSEKIETGGAGRGAYSYSLWGNEAAPEESAAVVSSDDEENGAAAEGEMGSESAGAAEPTAEELQRRAYQSICTKLLNHIKLIHKIPVNYRQAGVIYEALSGSDSKMQFYHKLIQILGRKKGGELYQRVKTTYKSIVGIYKAAEQNINAGAAGDMPAEAASGMGQEASGSAGNREGAIHEENEACDGLDVHEADLHDACGGRDVHAAAADIRNDFERAEQNQGNPGESVMRMVELAKNI